MASHPPQQCCTVGVKHDGDPTGSTTKIGDFEAYHAQPSGKTIHKDTAILYIPDVIGIWQNSQLMVDQFAANGYYTLMTDVFNGDPLPLNRPAGFDIKRWLNHGSTGDNPHTAKEVDQIVQKSIEHLKQQGFKKIGAVGYCFGAKYVTRFMAEGKGIDVGYVAHPSFVEEEELGAVQGPYSIAAAETDEIFPAEKRHKSETVLQGTKQPYQINLYSGVVHGFAVRAEITKKEAKFAKEQAFYQAVQWFDTWLV